MTDARDDTVARVTRNLELVRERIDAAAVDPASVEIVAVLKGHGVDAVRAAWAAGILHVGDNYADELVAHHDALVSDGPGTDDGDADGIGDGVDHGVERRALTWHFLGALQRNKLARLAPRVAVYETIAGARDATRVAVRAPGARCYVQVDVAGTPGRAGCRPGDEGAAVAAATAAGLEVLGLMCVATPDPVAAAREFAWLRGAADALGLRGCSMGMSDDLELACRAGTTQVRLGTALFGPRPPLAAPGLA